MKTSNELAKALEENHHRDSCLYTDYNKITGLTLLATSTNGTSGTGRYKGQKYYWNRDSKTGKFNVELW